MPPWHMRAQRDVDRLAVARRRRRAARRATQLEDRHLRKFRRAADAAMDEIDLAAAGVLGDAVEDVAADAVARLGPCELAQRSCRAATFVRDFVRARCDRRRRWLRSTCGKPGRP